VFTNPPLHRSESLTRDEHRADGAWKWLSGQCRSEEDSRLALNPPVTTPKAAPSHSNYHGLLSNSGTSYLLFAGNGICSNRFAGRFLQHSEFLLICS